MDADAYDHHRTVTGARRSCLHAPVLGEGRVGEAGAGINRTGSARRYQLEAVREARITAALRAAGYRIPDVRSAIAAMRDLDDVNRSLEALDKRLNSITERTSSLFRAAATLAEIIQSA